MFEKEKNTIILGPNCLQLHSLVKCPVRLYPRVLVQRMQQLKDYRLPSTTEGEELMWSCYIHREAKITINTVVHRNAHLCTGSTYCA